MRRERSFFEYKYLFTDKFSRVFALSHTSKGDEHMKFPIPWVQPPRYYIDAQINSLPDLVAPSAKAATQPLETLQLPYPEVNQEAQSPQSVVLESVQLPSQFQNQVLLKQ
jgi:hypothetical protein